MTLRIPPVFIFAAVKFPYAVIVLLAEKAFVVLSKFKPTAPLAIPSSLKISCVLLPETVKLPEIFP